MAAPRSLTPIMQKIRNILLRREYKIQLNYENTVAPRTWKEPRLPEGVHHKLANNDYMDRDGRRELQPPEVVYIGGHEQVTEGSISRAGVKKKRPVVPGFTFNWDGGAPKAK